MRRSVVCHDAALCNIARGAQRVLMAALASTSVGNDVTGSYASAEADTPSSSSTTAATFPARTSFALPETLQADLSKPSVVKDVRYKHVPSSRVGRAAGFASLFMQLGWEKLVGGTPVGSVLSERGHQHIVDTLCRMRGAVLKLGQMLSIQDASTIPPHVTSLFERVRDQAFAMPPAQLDRTLAKEFGSMHWRSELFDTFDETPVAAASIGQVHRAMLKPGAAGTDPSEPPVEVAVKVQYPGVAQSIDSDVANLKMLMSVGVLPPGMFVDRILQELRSELSSECQYKLEAAKQTKYRKLVADDRHLSQLFYVPKVFESISTDQVLVSEYVRGVPIDQLGKREDVPQELRNYIAEQLMSLTLKELFLWKFMQTDPNFSNFLYNASDQKVYLLDFGASREYADDFLSDYLDVVTAAAIGDCPTIIDKSVRLGFLTGGEAKEMLDAHCASVLLLGKPFEKRDEPFDFAAQNLPKMIQSYVPTMVRLRLRPPPTPIYSLHRRLSGTILLATKFKATIDSGKQFWSIHDQLRN
ncbi:putative mitochondrial ABC1 protein [Leptomonas pyrrhocoris]|uniref:Putative mitochondrial ABC1 protein n=1 Tax=Leptomonas pyrrhocoris TaxID=157538 RepID=A0A0N1J4Y0_LEPPY|nr:putative mitochondrial ABC1 protein [Leptomonas pyrrhocoris]KPA81508.1 putative mitochondrial ABC1 protein [Leptomonas pyrrhocoris]|eukprot:XP_015659947.1 putative mitochondrial ABC1 protein [Leptomonas pyrrhocoris]